MALTDGHVSIDKSDSTELSEAINPMYDWYQLSTVCYAYLSDIPTADNVLKQWSNLSSFDESQRLSKRRWFTRG